MKDIPEPMPVMQALELLWATIAQGAPDGGKWFSPNGGYVEVRWLNRKGTYRFTLDLMPPGTARDDQFGPDGSVSAGRAG